MIAHRLQMEVDGHFVTPFIPPATLRSGHAGTQHVALSHTSVLIGVVDVKARDEADHLCTARLDLTCIALHLYPNVLQLVGFRSFALVHHHEGAARDLESPLLPLLPWLPRGS